MPWTFPKGIFHGTTELPAHSRIQSLFRKNVSFRTVGSPRSPERFQHVPSILSDWLELTKRRFPCGRQTVKCNERNVPAIFRGNI
jgi:hypothetical protein